jgi:Raf kinase inhibitor-like YbhB/YbcL family protein
MGKSHFYSWLFCSFTVALFLFNGCGGGSGSGSGGGGQQFLLQSDSFQNQGRIPERCSYAGGNASPHLRWSGFPEQTRSFVITCIDINAENFVHWVVYDIPVYDIPVNNIDIPEGASGNFLNPIKEGQNNFGGTGYGGPDPPANERHQYRFTVYALSVATLGLPDGASYDQVISAMQGKVLARAELTGLYP